MADTRTVMLRLSSLVGERTLFENEPFRRLWLSKLLSHIPTNAVVYAMLVLIVQETGKSFFSSLIVVAYIAPTALLGTFSGVLVDRLPKGLVLAVTSAVRAALCILLALSVDSIFMIYVIAVLFAIGSQLSGPAEGASLPALVAPGDFTAANSLNNLQGLIAQIVGLMILPAAFLKTAGPEALFVVCALMFGAASFNFLLIDGLGGAVSSIPMSVAETRERFGEAWQRLSLDSVSYIALVMVVLANTTGLVLTTLLPRFSTQILGVSPENIIFVAAPAALGIWLALRFVRRVADRISPRVSIAASFALLLCCVALLAFVAPLGDALARVNPFGLFDPGPLGNHAARILITSVIGAALAFAFTFVNIVGRSIINERMPKEMQGRVLAGQTVLTNLASIPPILLAGFAADVAGVAPVFFLAALVCGLLALYYTARNLAMPVRTAY